MPRPKPVKDKSKVLFTRTSQLMIARIQRMLKSKRKGMTRQDYVELALLNQLERDESSDETNLANDGSSSGEWEIKTYRVDQR